MRKIEFLREDDSQDTWSPSLQEVEDAIVDEISETYFKGNCKSELKEFFDDNDLWTDLHEGYFEEIKERIFKRHGGRV